ncbi:hypothetical protein HDA32_000759 [Spinactinospora alkalitolerans]|uniref:Uncharacterized protein n=1 Tax=Spinactinospora alkalitolerans TaxID=687207 RepID=A0A852TNT5_9ACTN|nr:hypothetical protein [Spinactinospora alkalitolerans]
MQHLASSGAAVLAPRTPMAARTSPAPRPTQEETR